MLQEDGDRARDAVLPDAAIAAIVLGCYEHDHAFGPLIDVLAETGTR